MAFAIARAVAAASPASPCPGAVARGRAVARSSASGRTPAALSFASSAPDGVGFSAAGMIFPYHVGAWEVLCETGVLGPSTPVAGASAGALVAAMHACGLSPDEGRRVLMGVLRDCRENGVVGRVGGVLETALRRELPEDAHVRCSRSNLFVSVTAPAWADARTPGAPAGFNGGPGALENELISDFDSRDDLIGALLSSCHIPLYCGWPARRYRGRLRVDGGWTRLAPTPPVSERAVRVASFPLLERWREAPPGDGTKTGNYFERQASFWEDWGVSEDEGLLIAPDGAYGEPTMDFLEMGKWALLPQDDATLDALVEMGRADANRWATLNGFGGQGACDLSGECEAVF